VTFSDGNPMTRATDRLYVTLFIVALIAGFAFSLGSVGYLLGFNATTLVLIALSFTVMSANMWYQGEGVKSTEAQLQATSLAVIPIALRWALQMPLFQELVASIDGADAAVQLRYMAQVIGLWILVAVSEEAFRAAMLNAADLFAQFQSREIQDRWKILFANTVWILFHFLQRPLDLQVYGPYIVWLFAAGLVMTFALRSYGMGAATLIHLIVNLTA